MLDQIVVVVLHDLLIVAIVSRLHPYLIAHRLDRSRWYLHFHVRHHGSVRTDTTVAGPNGFLIILATRVASTSFTTTTTTTTRIIEIQADKVCVIIKLRIDSLSCPQSHRAIATGRSEHGRIRRPSQAITNRTLECDWRPSTAT